MEAIRKAGLTEFCVESRTHEGFCTDAWWEDFQFMLDYAREHGMYMQKYSGCIFSEEDRYMAAKRKKKQKQQE